jgi:alkylation response protein AidB-like acyl-CoA dehydrogenase
MSIDVPTEYGGSGQSFFSSVLVIEEFSKVDPSVGLFVDLQNTLLNRLFLNFGTEEQKHDYLPRMAKNLVLFFIHKINITKIVTCIYFSFLAW